MGGSYTTARVNDQELGVSRFVDQHFARVANSGGKLNIGGGAGSFLIDDCGECVGGLLDCFLMVDLCEPRGFSVSPGDDCGYHPDASAGVLGVSNGPVEGSERRFRPVDSDYDIPGPFSGGALPPRGHDCDRAGSGIEQLVGDSAEDMRGSACTPVSADDEEVSVGAFDRSEEG